MVLVPTSRIVVARLAGPNSVNMACSVPGVAGESAFSPALAGRVILLAGDLLFYTDPSPRYG